MNPQVNISEADLARLLPTCQRCRRLRRKCDTQLPACRLCQKGKAECTFYDHALQQNLPRSYVHSLMTRLGRLRSVQAAVDGTGKPPNILQAVQHSRNVSTATTQPDHRISDWGTYTSELSFDKHFVLDNANPTCWQFLGSSSAYALAVEVVVHAQAKFGQITHAGAEEYAGSEFALDAQAITEPATSNFRAAPERHEVEMLVDLYMQTTNHLTPYIENGTMPNEIETYLRLHGPAARYLTGREAHQFFRTSMICAVASANKARHQAKYAVESLHYYAEALQCVEEVTSDVSVEALQALLLLISFTLFNPRKGDIWKLLDFACRLSVELNYHTEPNDEYETEQSRLRRRCVFWGLYCLERTIGQHLGRPSDLPEDIITAEYPATLGVTIVDDPTSTQLVLISHYYRLTYLRSEIFRELYLPAAAPILPTAYYESRLEHIIEWRKEYQYLDEMLGMGSMTCEMGFDTTICFLFQPIMLRALNATRGQMLVTNTDAVIPRETYDSACRVIVFYNKMFRGAENSPHGMYPITVVSAHWIQQAALTVMAHCLLAIDGRLPVMSFSVDLSGETPGPMDFRNIYEVSGTCLILLSTLAKRFPGMVGILDIYKNLHDKVLPEMMRSDWR